MSAMDDFLWYSYFGITREEIRADNEEDKEKAQNACIQRAYLDLCRTLKYSRSVDGLKEKEKNGEKEYAKQYRDSKKAFLEKEKNCIRLKIKALFKNGKDFDGWHKCTCGKLIDIAKDSSTKNNELLFGEGFSYGQAQKWLNMTLKYMWLMGFWNNDEEMNEKIIDALHVPVDDYILEAALDSEILNPPIKAREGLRSVCWSRWNYEGKKCEDEKCEDKKNKCTDSYKGNYIKFQRYIQENKGENKNRIEWEQKAWIKIAKNRKAKEEKRGL